jgi:hypothetical protein
MPRIGLDTERNGFVMMPSTKLQISSRSLPSEFNHHLAMGCVLNFAGLIGAWEVIILGIMGTHQSRVIILSL